MLLEFIGLVILLLNRFQSPRHILRKSVAILRKWRCCEAGEKIGEGRFKT